MCPARRQLPCEVLLDHLIVVMLALYRQKYLPSVNSLPPPNRYTVAYEVSESVDVTLVFHCGSDLRESRNV